MQEKTPKNFTTPSRLNLEKVIPANLAGLLYLTVPKEERISMSFKGNQSGNELKIEVSPSAGADVYLYRVGQMQGIQENPL